MASEKIETAALLAPRRELAGALFLAIARDTRACALSPEQRFNVFPASPLCAISIFLEGESWLVPRMTPQSPDSGERLPQISVSGPQRRPITSWNPGVAHAISIGFYPDVWRVMMRGSVADHVDATMAIAQVAQPWFAELCATASRTQDCARAFDVLQDGLAPVWRARRLQGRASALRLEDWTRALHSRAIAAGAGRSLRQTQRRIKSWTGQAARNLGAHARAEKLFAASRAPDAPALARLAVDMGYADQSHMTREVRRVTGLPPVALRNAIEHDEAFWCYRLLGALP